MLNFLVDKVYAETVVGRVQVPAPFNAYGGIENVGLFISNILRILFVIGGILALFSFVIAGFEYITAAGDAKKLASAWDRIWQSLLGLIILVGSFAIISFFGYLIFGDAGFIFNPQVFGPGDAP